MYEAAASTFPAAALGLCRIGHIFVDKETHVSHVRWAVGLARMHKHLPGARLQRAMQLKAARVANPVTGTNKNVLDLTSLTLQLTILLTLTFWSPACALSDPSNNSRAINA